MVVGNGLIANAFLDYKERDQYIIFASGVSNSKENRVQEFNREKSLLIDTAQKYPNKTFIYFSTCAFYDEYFSENQYLIHKKELEEWIIENVTDFMIFRVPQIIGSKNKNQLLGFLNFQIQNQIAFDLFNIERNLIDLDFLYKSVDYILEKKIYQNEILNLSYPLNISVLDIVKIFEKIYSKKALFNRKEVEGSFTINSSKLYDVYNKLNLIIPDYYSSKIISNYG
jgi:nucleoside-diphosphate-sugar epimerase